MRSVSWFKWGAAGAAALALSFVVSSGAGAPRPTSAMAQDPAAAEPYAPPPVVPEHSVARLWNDQILNAIRIDRPKPPVHARNLFHLSVAMWDAWAAYDPIAIGYLTAEKHVAADVLAARNEAISHAAQRLLRHRFQGGGFDVNGKPCQPGAAVSLAQFDATMVALGFDPDFTSTVGDTPAAVGNRIGQAVIDYGLTDGANEGFDLCYPDDSNYFPTNSELIFKLPGTTVVDPNRWQPLAFDLLVLQNGIILGAATQSFVGVGWGDVKPFGLTPADLSPPGSDVDCATEPTALPPYLSPGCPPQLGGVGDAVVKAAAVESIRFSSYMDSANPAVVDHSPSVYGNNPLGSDDGTGHPINPYTCEPYAPNPMKLADFARVNAEFWADGPQSETPPGHWNTLANYVTDHPALGEKRLGGAGGPLLDDLEWDVKLYLALNGATHDAAVWAWGAKHHYDSSRPITLIRHMGGLGQSSDIGGPSYHPDGLPLVPDLIEVITADTVLPGGRHEHLKAFCAGGGPDTNVGKPCDQLDADHDDSQCPDDGPFDGFCDSSVGKIAIFAWRGQPADPDNETGGAGWIRAIDWMPYQAATFVTPPFPGYTSGHSTYSGASAQVLTAFIGSPFFPGGLGSFVAPADTYLSFEKGPTQTVELQWATYRDAADEAGISRRYGGIHPYYDDYPSRVQAVSIGQRAFDKALQFFVQEPGNGIVDPGNCDGDDEDGDDEDDDAILVCHVTQGKGKPKKTIVVAAAAVPAHLAHGDTLGSCEGALPAQTEQSQAMAPGGQPQGGVAESPPGEPATSTRESGPKAGLRQDPPVPPKRR